MERKFSINNFVKDYHERWRDTGREELEFKLQSEIEGLESELSGSKQIRRKSYQTPLGTIHLKRRAYPIGNKLVCVVDQLLGLPDSGWLAQVEELAVGLGISSEFSNAQKLFTKITGIEITDRTLANRVEGIGEDLSDFEDEEIIEEIQAVESVLTHSVKKKREVVYVGADGIMVPLKGGDYKEGKVGIVFKESEHLRISKARAIIKNREYAATMNKRDDFKENLYKKYLKVVGSDKVETIVLGDGAKWIWDMANSFYPGCTEILDFFHVAEYVWSVARVGFIDASEQKDWVETQLKLLKDSRANELELKLFPLNTPELKLSIDKLKRYLKNNSNRIDYKSYIQRGLMIGSGVVESSNKKIVTQRLKQSGMFWWSLSLSNVSKIGADSIMKLRASYYSSSQAWDNFWNIRAA